MTNNTEYEALNGKILIKTVAYISSLEIGVNKNAVPIVPPQHFIISSSVPDYTEGMQVLLDEASVQETGIRLSVSTDKNDAKYIFNYINNTLTPPERMEYVKKHPKVKIHSYLFVNRHDIIAKLK